MFQLGGVYEEENQVQPGSDEIFCEQFDEQNHFDDQTEQPTGNYWHDFRRLANRPIFQLT